MNRLLLTKVLLLLSSTYAFSQQLPIFSNYVFDPYLYNPAYIANGGFSEINFIHRRQWVDIQNAPVTSGINAQIPLNSRLALGINAINDESILLNRISGGVTVGYKVPLSSEHHLGFGLSVGAIYNSLNLDGIETLNDPALANAEDNNASLDGIMYSWKNLSLGFSLPRLFITDLNQQNSFGEVEFAELRNQIVIASYKVELSPIINVQPFLQYRLTQDEQDFFEAAALVGYKDLLKVGGFYRQNSGPGFLFQLTASDLVSISYGHEFATNQDLSFAGATHEFQLKLRLGKKKAPLTVRDKSVNPNDALITENVPKEDKKVELDSVNSNNEVEVIEKAKDNPSNQIDETEAPTVIQVEPGEPELNLADKNVDDDKEIDGPAPIQEMTTGYYLVIGSFHTEEYARSLYKKVAEIYPESQIGYDESTDFYFVYTKKISESENSLEAIQKIRETTPYKDAWFKRIK